MKTHTSTTVEEIVKTLQVPCSHCRGEGDFAEHGDHNPETGECIDCPIQVQCQECHATGNVVPVDEVSKLLTQHQKELEEVRALLKECEPFLSDGSSVGITTLEYKTPAESMRQAADRMDYEADLKRRVKEALTPPTEGKETNHE